MTYQYVLQAEKLENIHLAYFVIPKIYIQKLQIKMNFMPISKGNCNAVLNHPWYFWLLCREFLRYSSYFKRIQERITHTKILIMHVERK